MKENVFNEVNFVIMTGYSMMKKVRQSTLFSLYKNNFIKNIGNKIVQYVRTI